MTELTFFKVHLLVLPGLTGFGANKSATKFLFIEGVEKKDVGSFREKSIDFWCKRVSEYRVQMKREVTADVENTVTSTGYDDSCQNYSVLWTRKNRWRVAEIN